MDINNNTINTILNDNSVAKIIIKDTNSSLFDITKPVQNELMFYSLWVIFLISLWLTIWIKIEWKKRRNKNLSN